MKNLIIDTAAVRQNLRVIREKADGSQIIADLSANAQGLGLLKTAEILRAEGIKTFAVSDPRDAAALRERGFTEEKIMMLRSTADSGEVAELIELGVILTVGSHNAAVVINGLSEKRNQITQVQIEIDTGLGRYGFQPEETDKIDSVYKYMSSLKVVGTFTNFAAPWLNKRSTLVQLDTFNAVLDKIQELGHDPGITHCCDSETLFRYDFGRLDAVRADTALSGRMHKMKNSETIKVGYVEAGIEELGWVPKGHRYGAERSVITTAPTKIAVLSVGYYHGFGVDRTVELGSVGIGEWMKTRRRKLYVRLGGQRARVLGNVGLMHTLIDVTKIDCTVGDKCILDVDPVNVKGLPVLYR